MSQFSGFPVKSRLVKIPGLFFSELLPQIDDLGELKVTLYCFWRLQRKADQTPFLWDQEIAADEGFMAGLGASVDEQASALRAGLEGAVKRGTLISVSVKSGKQTHSLVFVNTPRGRAMAEGAAGGKWKPEDGPQALLSAAVERPNIFGLYEQNIGPLTPMISERLKDMEKTYPAAWIDEAVGIAVARNKRSLAYMEGILRRWQSEGRDESSAQAADGSRFISGKYRDEINY